MKTISSEKSLVLFDQNRSGSNIHHINEGIGIETGGIQEYSLLFYPSRIEQGEKDYIASSVRIL